MGPKKAGQRGWMSDKEARAKAAKAHRRDAFRQGRAGKISAEEVRDRLDEADRRTRRWF